MRTYLKVIQCSFRRYSTYRTATAAGAFTNTVWGFIKAYIFMALWHARGEIGGYDVVDAITFAFLCQAFAAPLSMFSLSIDMPERIRNGDIIIDLQRPIDFQGWWLAADIGRASFQLIWRAFPLIIGAIFFTIRVPDTTWLWVAFAVSVYLGIVVSFAIRYIVALSVWWIMDSRGVNALSGLLMMFFSGMVVPLVLLPGWFGILAKALPWSAMVQVPADIFLGRYPANGVLGELGFQALWALLILALGRALTVRIRHAVVIQGG